MKDRYKAPWRHFKEVTVLVDLFLWACSECENVILLAKDPQRLDEAMEKSVKNENIS